MEKLTLEQCNALPISDLFMAVIEEPLNSKHSQEFSDESKEGKRAKEEATQKISDLIDRTMERSKIELTEDLREKIDIDFLKKAIVDASVSMYRVTVVYMYSDGTYLDLNGYYNEIYSSEHVKCVEPFANYYADGTYKFVEGPLDKGELFSRGIYIDVDSLEGYNRYQAKIDEMYDNADDEP